MKILPAVRVGKSLFASCMAVLCLHYFSDNVYAQVPTITYTVTGNPDDWTLDFTVLNSISQPQDVVYFQTSVGPITGSPAGFTKNYFVIGSTPFDEWSGGSIAPGQSVSGFEVLDTADATAPVSEGFFDHLANGSVQNGTAELVTVPDGGSTVAGLCIGFAALMGIRRKCLASS